MESGHLEIAELGEWSGWCWMLESMDKVGGSVGSSICRGGSRHGTVDGKEFHGFRNAGAAGLDNIDFIASIVMHSLGNVEAFSTMRVP